MRHLAQPRPAPAAGPRPRSGPAVQTKTIPFDYLFTFRLTGEPRNRVQDVVAISIEGRFVAVSMGYSVVPDGAGEAQRFEPAPDPAAAPEPAITAVLFPGTVAETVDVTSGSTPQIPRPQARVVGTPGAAVALIELRSLEVAAANLSAEGTAQVELPGALNDRFGQALQVIDTTHGIAGGIVQLRPEEGASWTPTLAADRAGRTHPVAGEADAVSFFCFGTPQLTVIPFVVRRSLQVDALPAVSLEPTDELMEGFTTGRTAGAVSIPTPLRPGDTLGVRYPNSSLLSTFTIPRPHPSSVTLGSLAAGLARSGRDLTQGFRLDPAAAPLFNADPPLDELSARQLTTAFLTGCRGADEVSFLYSIDTVGSGRELQSAPIHNIAGLGVADGDRPFRPFAKPVVFEPRSSIRFQIEELGGPAGTLYIVLQGYKVLGTGQPAR